MRCALNVLPCVLSLVVHLSSLDARAEDSDAKPAIEFLAVPQGVPERLKGKGLADWADEVLLEDLTGDGKLDAVISFDDNYTLWKGDGKGGFAEYHWFQHTKDRVISLCDLDCDDDLDLIVETRIWRNDGHGSLSKDGYALRNKAYPIHFTDFDADGDADTFGWWPQAVHVNDGTGKFEQAGQDDEHNLLGKRKAGCFTVADFDQDSDPDIVLISRDESIVLLNSGDGVFRESIDLVFEKFTAWNGKKAPLQGGNHLGFLDIDGDLDLDVYVARGFPIDAAETDLFYRNDGAGRFRLDQTLPAADTMNLDLADFDLDGDLDCFAAADNCGLSKLWINNRNGKLSDSGVDFGAGAHGVDIGDVDSDGDIDIFVAGCVEPTVWLNQTNP